MFPLRIVERVLPDDAVVLDGRVVSSFEEVVTLPRLMDLLLLGRYDMHDTHTTYGRRSNINGFASRAGSCLMCVLV